MTSHGSVLLYNFVSDERTGKIRHYLSRAGIGAREVQAAEFLHPLGYLFGIPGFEPDPRFNLGGNFREEMMVLKDFSPEELDAFLRFFREEGLAPVGLKAVLTPVTRHWNSLQLHQELSKEQEAFRRRKS